jgi:dihydrofolate reductase
MSETQQGKVVWHVSMSVDGFIAGAEHAMDWVFEYDDPIPMAEEVMNGTGAILAGRNSYEVGEDSERPETSEPYGGRWQGPEFVLTHEPPADPSNPRLIFLSGDVREAVEIALAAADGRNLEVFGANVNRQCVEAGLVDELIVHLVPILLGDGVRLYGEPAADPARLELVETDRSGQLASLRYRFRR